MWGSGDIETRDYDLRGFLAVCASSFKIEVIQSDTFAVTVHADRDLFNGLDVRKSGTTLHLHKKRFHWDIGHERPEATIHMPAIESVELSGATSVRMRDFRGIDRLNIKLTGASELTAHLDAEAIDAEATGASRLNLDGSATRVMLDASGASKLDLTGLVATNGSVELSGASSATVNFTEAIDFVEASGASHLRYLGDPKIGQFESSGASRVARVA
ncbi:MAG: head GIN domain-containing protein [Dehalococcoidia bacterium]